MRTELWPYLILAHRHIQPIGQLLCLLGFCNAAPIG